MTDTPVRVLVAEDDAFVAELIENDLRAIGAVVVGRAPDGLSAVEMTASLEPDVVLMDIKMPKLDGIKAALAIQGARPTPVVMVTAYDDLQTVEGAAEAGAGAFLTKPTSPSALTQAIIIARARFADLMKLRRLNAELRAALASVKTLSGFLPICSGCKKIRDTAGSWQEVEVYVRDHTSAEFTHGLCPACAHRLYPEEQ
jgi:AmiR/NasT family two-component response regulator